MTSLILRETTRRLMPLILVFSVFILIRGHNHPGGGFSGGLIASIAFCLLAFTSGARSARRSLRADPRIIGACGLVIAILSGTLGALMGSPFLTSQWIHVAGIHIGTPVLFDVGVYLVVIGTVMTLVLGIKEQ